MRQLKKNKQKMWYAIPIGTKPQYKLDDKGNPIVIYVDSEGVEHYEETGQTEIAYSIPIEFKANISSKLNRMHLEAFGVSQSSIYSEIVVNKGYLPVEFSVGTVVWRTNKIGYKGVDVDISTADYTVMGIMTESLYEDWYLLQRNNSDGVLNG